MEPSGGGGVKMHSPSLRQQMVPCIVLNERGKTVFGLLSKKSLYDVIACAGALVECEECHGI